MEKNPPSKNTSATVKSEIPVTGFGVLGVVVLLAWGLSSLISTDNTSSVTTTTPSSTATPFYTITTARIRSCASIDCGVIGQYPQNTEMDLNYNQFSLPDWVPVSWTATDGTSQSGYISKTVISTTRVSTTDSVQIQTTTPAPSAPPKSDLPKNGVTCNGQDYTACPDGTKAICPADSGAAYCPSPPTIQTQSVTTNQQQIAPPVKTGYQICSDTFPNETWDGTYGADGKYNCVCKAGYGWNVASASCQIQQQQVTQPIGISGATSGQAITSSIDGDFNGWDGETLYKLLNGQYWQQTDYHYHYHYAYSPKILIYASNGGYKMHVEGDNDQDVSVIQITNVLESRIDGEFTGWEGSTAYALVNGQVWQQTDYHYHYHYAYSPQVIIYRSYSGVIKMHVKGDTDKEISVSRIK